MTKKVLIEKMYEGMDEEDIVIYWHKEEGSTIQEGETIVEAETFKSTFEIPSPITGYLLRQCIKNGEEASIGMAIGIVSETLEDTLDENECS